MTKTQAITQTSAAANKMGLPREKSAVYCHWVESFFGWLAKFPDQPKEPSTRVSNFVAAVEARPEMAPLKDIARESILFFYREVMEVDVSDCTFTKSQAIAEIRRLCQLRSYAYSTEDTYCHWTGRFFDWLKKRRRECAAAPAARMEGFLSDLAETDVSASTQNQAFSAILFFYRNVMKQEPGDVNALRARKSTFLRHAPAKNKVRQMLEAVQDSPSYPFRLIVFMIYGMGARVSEPLGVRIRDIDLSRKRIILRQAKGSKDRMVPIPDCLLAPIHHQINAAKAVWQRAMAQNVPVKLPNKLGKKYKSAGVEFEWFWLFPAPNSCICRRSKERVWWHGMPDGVQDAVRAACRAAGFPGSVKPHDLRHSWATHASDDGANIRDIQEILGHKSLETTMIYVHTDIERVASPLESLNIAV